MNRMLERMSHVLLAAAVLAVLSLTSCEHKDLCYDHYHNTKYRLFSIGRMLLTQLLRPCAFTCSL